MRVIFILPGLLDPAPAGYRKLDCLRRLLACSDRRVSIDLDARLLFLSSLISPHKAVIQSKLAYWSDFLSPPAGYCYYCEPVHLRADLSDALIFDSSHFTLTPVEAQALVDAINQYLQGRDRRIEMAAPQRWYLLSESPIAANAPTLREMKGRPVGGVLTDPGLAPDWHRLMSELQIVLHEHTVNAGREQRGELPVNGVWIHAGNAIEGHGYAVSRVITRSPYARVLSAGFGLNCSEELDESPTFADGGSDMLVFDESLADTTGHRQMRLESMEECWFKPVYRWLQQKKIDEVIIYPDDNRRRFVIRRQYLRRFWRRLYPAIFMPN